MSSKATQKQDDLQNREQPVEINATITKLFTARPNFSAGKFVEKPNGKGGITGDSGKESKEESTDKVFFDALFASSFVAFCQLTEGDNVKMTGRWSTHPKFGRQFKAETVQHIIDFSAAGLEQWLRKNNKIQGIGPGKARKIAETYGERFDEVIRNSPEEVQCLVKITDEQLAFLQAEWNAHRDFAELITWLAQYGLSIREIEALREKYGSAAIGLIQNDPYILIGEIPRFGFKTVDAIALKTGISKSNPSRINHGILWTIRQIEQEGHIWQPIEDLVREAERTLELDDVLAPDIIRDALDRLKQSGDVVYEHTGDGTAIALSAELHENEDYLAKIFARFIGHGVGNPHFKKVTHEWLSEELAGIVDQNGNHFTLNPAQENTAGICLSNSIVLITGGAGTGKTYTINAIKRIYEKHGFESIALCAPTGKAARRMEESCDAPAETIHRLLEYKPWVGFQRNESFPIDADVVICDEVSMLDSRLARSLFRAINLTKTAVVMVGDPNQLPPVGPGNLLRDIIEADIIPIARLDEVVRQAGILKKNSTAILSGKVERIGLTENGGTPWQVVDHLQDAAQCRLWIEDVFTRILTAQPNIDLIRSFQILTPQKERDIGVNRLNAELQRIVQQMRYGVTVDPIVDKKRARVLLHDKVIQTRNDYNTDVMNGTIGQVVDGEKDGSLVVQFDGIEGPVTVPAEKTQFLELAYALTIHKSQGSEFPFVILVIHKSHSFMHSQNLMYTGATRAKTKLIIVGDRWAIDRCAKLATVDKRRTWMREAFKRWSNHPPNGNSR